MTDLAADAVAPALGGAAAARAAVDPHWNSIDDEECRRFSGALELVGRKWASGILLALARGASRFSEIADSVVGLSDRLLAVRLKELEHAGLVIRSVQSTTPVTVRYALTRRGEDLMASLQPLVRYGQRWHGDEAADSTGVAGGAEASAGPEHSMRQD